MIVEVFLVPAYVLRKLKSVLMMMCRYLHIWITTKSSGLFSVHPTELRGRCNLLALNDMPLSCRKCRVGCSRRILLTTRLSYPLLTIAARKFYLCGCTVAKNIMSPA